jgi:beta-lactamase superfamily II metal-dependent hydrolase
LLAGPRLPDDPERIAWSAGGVPLPLVLVRNAAVPPPLVLAKSPRLDVVPLPLAGAVAEGSRVVSCGIDADGKVHPVVGVWHQDEPGHATVEARTQAPVEGCVGAPVICEGRLAGVVTEGAANVLQVVPVSPELMRLAADSPDTPSPGPVDVELLPAAQGQAVLLSWGPPRDRHHLLVDGGPRATARRIVARIRQATGGRLDLVVVSHADADRVEGVTALLEAGIEVHDLWFNGPAQLEGGRSDLPAPSVAVERLLQRLRERGVPINQAFSGGPAVAHADSELPRVRLPGGASLVLAGPTPARLAALASQWQRTAQRRAAGEADRPPAPAEGSARADAAVDDVADDTAAAPTPLPAASPPRSAGEATVGSTVASGVSAPPKRPLGGDRGIHNGASIVLLFEHANERVLLPGDSWADPLVEAVRRLAQAQGRSMLHVDLFVLPHGGSRGNVKPELFDVLEPGSIAICTDGSRYGHPDPETMELLAGRAHGAAMVFNHRSDPLRAWADQRFQGLPLRTRFPDNDEGIVISLQPGPPRSSLA